MANRTAIASGNWSNPAIWNGGLGLPTASDDVYANGQTVTIDQNVTIISLRSTGVGASAGTFILNNGITVTANIFGGAATNPTTQISQSNSAIIIGNITGGQTRALIMSDASNITITGSVSPATGASFHGIQHSSTGNLIISGNLSNNVIAQAFVINHLGTGNIIITGSLLNTNTATAAHTISSTGNSSIYVMGSVTGSRNVASFGINKTNLGTVSIQGTCIAQTGSAVAMSSAGILIISGTISSSITSPGIQSSSTTATNLFTGPFYNTGSFNAVYAYRMQMLSTSSQWTFDTETAGVTKTLYTSNLLPGVPQQNNVRKGTTYNFGLTGSLAMPDPTTVQLGVETDNTTGSAIFTAEDMFGVLTQNITDSGSIGNLLTGASTAQTVGATISAFKV
jgi:hypothetical protein